MSAAVPTDFVQTARSAWGADLPDWVLELAQECARTSQSRTAARLGRSGSLVSAVLRRKYEGNMAAVEELVRGALMRAVVDCPALGELPTNECQLWRKRSRAFSGHNALRVRMYRACTRCPLNKGASEK
ncbi:hypothetical protein T8T21_00825 [Limimaricola variabilis]|uniref:hypothetical protein n=1 Tax=Limimaricola variabilis TaxID=1492771 RepID=UPI002AC980F8|nr:hypothetical protein [Limimaricola variabilis]WPY94702.1 hypothetical protein T8T21_00825 [Limimaricola variabilis]